MHVTPEQGSEKGAPNGVACAITSGCSRHMAVDCQWVVKSGSNFQICVRELTFEKYDCEVLRMYFEPVQKLLK
jgi:hypothetical protein